MINSNIPKIKIQPPTTVDRKAQSEWKALVGKNLGPEVEHLYKDNTELHVFEPAKLMRENLEKAIQVFNNELSKKEKSKALDSTKLQTFDDLTDAIKTAADTWASRERKFPGVRDKLIKFLNSASHYQNLIAIFPSQSQYTSSFCAALKILITAATNYQDTADGLTRALAEINVAAKNVSDLNALFNTAEIRDYVVSFYTSIIRFFMVAINWYQSRARRIIGNFKDNLYAEVQEIVTSIKNNAEIIKAAAAKGNMAEIRAIHDKINHQEELLISCLEEQKKQLWVGHMFVAFVNQQNNRSQRSLTRRSHSKKGRRSASRSQVHRALPAVSPYSDCEKDDDGDCEKEIQLPCVQVYPQREIVNLARRNFVLGEADPKRYLRACTRAPGKNIAPNKQSFRERLNLWMSQSSSSLLWVRGDPSSQKISPITLLTSQLINSASFADIRVAFHLCTFYSYEAEEQPILVLIQSLILQLLEFEKVDFETIIDLSEARFVRAGSTFDEAWGLLEDILRICSARTVFLAIDCLERFDEDENCNLLIQKLETLAENNSTECETMVKVLLTSKRNTTKVFDHLPKRVGLYMKTERKARGRGRVIRNGSEWSQGDRTTPSGDVVECGSPEEDSSDSGAKRRKSRSSYKDNKYGESDE